MGRVAMISASACGIVCSRGKLLEDFLWQVEDSSRREVSDDADPEAEAEMRAVKSDDDDDADDGGGGDEEAEVRADKRDDDDDGEVEVRAVKSDDDDDDDGDENAATAEMAINDSMVCHSEVEIQGD